MSQILMSQLDPPTHLCQFDTDCGKIRYVSDLLVHTLEIPNLRSETTKTPWKFHMIFS